MSGKLTCWTSQRKRLAPPGRKVPSSRKRGAPIARHAAAFVRSEHARRAGSDTLRT